MKKIYALLISCLLVTNGSAAAVLAEDGETPAEEPVQETEEQEETVEEVTEEAEETAAPEEVIAEDEPAAEIVEEAEEAETLTEASDKAFTIHFKCGGPYQPKKDEQFDLTVEPGTGQTFPDNDGRFSTVASEQGITFWYDPNGGTMDPGTDFNEDLNAKGYSGFKIPCRFTSWWIRSLNKWFRPGDAIPSDLAKPGETVEAEARFHSDVIMPQAVKPGFTLVGWNDGWKTYNPGETYHLDMSFLMTAQWIGFEEEGGKFYWYETVADKEGHIENVRQGTYDDPKGVMGDGTIRGREVFDPISSAWYWLDARYDGAKATGKEVWMPYIFQDEKTMSAEKKEEWRTYANTYTEDPDGTTAEMGDQLMKAIEDGTGKWVRYDENGKMLKGWVTIDAGSALAALYPDQVGNTYYYDYATGLMAKGRTVIGGTEYYFDEITGNLQK